jgi:biotin synthase-like enzyme
MSDGVRLGTGELVSRAGAVRDAVYGTRVTYSPKVFVPLTMLCRDRCGYCTFAHAPRQLPSPYLELDEVLAIAERGAELGLPSTGTAPRSTTWLRRAERSSIRPGCSRTPTAAPCTATSWPHCAR